MTSYLIFGDWAPKPTKNYELCSNWVGKKPKITRYLGCLGQKLRRMSIIQNTENFENENYEGKNYEVTV